MERCEFLCFALALPVLRIAEGHTGVELRLGGVALRLRHNRSGAGRPAPPPMRGLKERLACVSMVLFLATFGWSFSRIERDLSALVIVDDVGATPDLPPTPMPWTPMPREHMWFENAPLFVFCSFAQYEVIPGHYDTHHDIFREISYFGPPPKAGPQGDARRAFAREFNVTLHTDMTPVHRRFNVRGEYAAMYLALENRTLSDDSPGWIVAHDDAFLVLWNWGRFDPERMMIGYSDQYADIRYRAKSYWFNEEWGKNYLNAIKDPEFPLERVRNGPCKSEYNVTKSQVDVVYFPKRYQADMIKYTRLMHRHTVWLEIGLATIMHCFFGDSPPPQEYILETRWEIRQRNNLTVTKQLFKPEVFDVVHPVKFSQIGEDARVWVDDWLRLRIPNGYMGDRRREVGPESSEP